MTTETEQTTGTQTKPCVTVVGSDGVAAQVPAAVGERMRELEEFLTSSGCRCNAIRELGCDRLCRRCALLLPEIVVNEKAAVLYKGDSE